MRVIAWLHRRPVGAQRCPDAGAGCVPAGFHRFPGRNRSMTTFHHALRRHFVFRSLAAWLAAGSMATGVMSAALV